MPKNVRYTQLSKPILTVGVAIVVAWAAIVTYMVVDSENRLIRRAVLSLAVGAVTFVAALGTAYVIVWLPRSVSSSLVLGNFVEAALLGISYLASFGVVYWSWRKLAGGTTH
jgi:hypothetical protein